MKLKSIGLIFTCMLLSSCAAIQASHERWVRRNCNPTAAYNAGLTHGLTPGETPDSYADNCPSNKSAIDAAYLNGFSVGAKSRPVEININKNVNVTKDKTS